VVPPIDQLYKFVVTSVVILLIPGPSVLFVISRGIILGRRAAIATVLGNSTGAFLQMALVALGLGAVVEKSLTVYNVIKFVGAAYLIYLGIQAFRHRSDAELSITTTGSSKSVRRIVREGFVVGISNPKLVVFASAALPNFVDRKRGYVPGQMLGLAAMFAVLSIVTDGTYALVAGSARKWLARKPKRLGTISGAGGLAIVGLGINLALSRRSD
jgi:threonine/homoserine/homoserine lactone efflux protein